MYIILLKYCFLNDLNVHIKLIKSVRDSISSEMYRQSFIATIELLPFSTKATTTGTRLIGNETNNKFFPCITFCPWPAFRTSEFSFTNQSFEENTFKQSEVFNPIPEMTDLSNTSNYFVEELKSF